uniref:hypothetical protein n=1 Tax=Lactobacillus crispatus TaxID=47770 RepID=UPI0022E30F54
MPFKQIEKFKINNKNYFIRQGDVVDLKQICSLIKQIQPDMHVSIHTYLSFFKNKTYYIYILEDEQKEAIGFDIRYEINKTSLCLHEDGILLEYSFLSHAFRNSLLTDSAQHGYKFLYTHIQDSSKRTMSYIIQLKSNLIGYQKNRWLDHYKDIVLPINALYFKIPLASTYTNSSNYRSIILMTSSYNEDIISIDRISNIRNIIN